MPVPVAQPLFLVLMPAALLIGETLFASDGKPHRVDPAGLRGTLLLCGADFNPTEHAGLLRRLVTDQATVVLWSTRSDTSAARWKQALTSASHRLEWHVSEQFGDLAADDSEHPLRDSPDVLVLLDHSPLQSSQSTTQQLMEAASTVLQREGTVIAVGGAATALCNSTTLLPGICRLTGSRDEKTHRLVLDLPDAAALLVSGRAVANPLRSLPVRVELPAGSGRDARIIEITSRTPADLVALQRASQARQQPYFLPEQIDRPHVASGSLFIVGGGRMDRELIRLFIEKAGGDNSRIVVIPTATESPNLVNRRDVRDFLDAGAGAVTVMHATSPAEAATDQFLEPLRTATGVWFGGGRQWRLLDAYEDTPFVDLCHDVLTRGGVIGGSSAGATIQGEYLVRGHPLGNTIMMAEGYERGFAFLPGCAIDQHFTQRNRQRDLELVKRTFPQLLCIGIDEATALLVEGNEAIVAGRGTVTIYDGPRGKLPLRPALLHPGGRYDLRSASVLDTGTPHSDVQATTNDR